MARWSNRTCSISCGERLGDALEHTTPIAGPGLAEESHVGIPRAVLKRELPAPFRRMRQQQPHRAAKRAGEMGERGIHSDD